MESCATQQNTIQSTRDLAAQQLLQFQNIVVTTQMEVQILSRLRFESIFEREDGITNATKGTFTRLLQDTELSSWLKSGSGIFHVSGKAGSGKSTLMKLIHSHDQTKGYLEQWAGARDLLYAAFFFWGSGSSEQKSLKGLFRSILFTILSKKPEWTPEVFPDYWNKSEHSSPGAIEEITRDTIIKEAFSKLIQIATGGNNCVCLFIDGLDEYSGDNMDHWDLAKQLCNWADSSNGSIKFCVSSRPRIQFQESFAPRDPNRHQVHLHDLNCDDIKKHCEVRFIDKEFQNLSSLQEARHDLIQEIGRRADGVFLWAYLVVRIILTEAKLHGTTADLRQKLEEIPDGIDKLYEQMLGALSPGDRKMANIILLVVLTNPFENALNALCLRWLKLLVDGQQSGILLWGKDYTEEEAAGHINYVKSHLDSWTRGLVETVELRAQYYKRSLFENLPHVKTRVKLFHSTVKEYLMQPHRLQELHSDYSDLHLKELHVRLRLTEANSMRHYDKRDMVVAIYRYGYEILITKGDHQGFFQVPWFLLRELARVLPSYSPMQTFNPSPYRHIQPLTGPEQTSLLCLATATRQDVANVTTRLNTLNNTSDKSRNVLLSACISRLLHNRQILDFDEVISQDLVKSLIHQGYSGRDKVEIFGDHKEPSFFRKAGVDRASIWVILVAALVFDEDRQWRIFIHTVGKLIKTLTELLLNEPQEEVILLGSIGRRDSYDCFITLREIFMAFGPGIPRHTLDDMLPWPTYETGSQNSRNAPIWVWSWHGKSKRSIADSLTKLTVQDCEENADTIRLCAVVSRSELFEELKPLSGGFVMVW